MSVCGVCVTCVCVVVCVIMCERERVNTGFLYLLGVYRFFWNIFRARLGIHWALLLFCKCTGLFCRYVGLFWVYIGLIWGYIGLFC